MILLKAILTRLCSLLLKTVCDVAVTVDVVLTTIGAGLLFFSSFAEAAIMV